MPTVDSDIQATALPKFLLAPTGAEFDKQDFPVDYLVDGMLVAGQPCLVAGGKKTLKTSTMLDLGLSCATGEPVLGRFIVKRQCSVLFMSGESGSATLQETARRIMASKGGSLSHVENMRFCANVPNFGNPSDVSEIECAMTTFEPEILMLDPAYMIVQTNGNEGSIFSMGESLRKINELCQKHGATLVLAHHTKKGIGHDPYEPPELDDIAWAGFQEYARQWILISRRERFEPGTGEHKLWLNLGGSAGHSSLWGLDVNEGAYWAGRPRTWDVTLESASSIRSDNAAKRDQSQQDKKEQTARNNLFNLLKAARKYPAGETKRTLFAAAGLSGSAGNKALAAAMDESAIVACEVSKNNQVLEGFRLVEEPESCSV